MTTYHDRLVCEATLQYADEYDVPLSEAIHDTGHATLATMAKKPDTRSEVAKARDVADKDRWAEICRDFESITPQERNALKNVWATMPTYTCLADAAVITARL